MTLVDPFDEEIKEMAKGTHEYEGTHEYVCMRKIYKNESKRPLFNNVDTNKYSQLIKIIEGTVFQ